MGQHPNIGIAGSRLENPDGTPQRSAFRFHTPLSEFERSLNIGFVTRVLDTMDGCTGSARYMLARRTGCLEQA